MARHSVLQWTLRRVATIVTGGTLLLTACTTAAPVGSGASPTGGAAQTASAAAATPQRSVQKVTINTVAPVTALDYAAAQYVGVPIRQAALLGSGGYLYSYLPDGSIEPDLAEDMPKPAGDGLAMTVTLRANLKYSDGTAVTANDVVASFTRAKNGAQKTRFASVDKATASGDRTVVFSLNAPINMKTQANVFAYWFSIHPQGRLADAKYWEKPVSASRYTIVDWVPGGPSMTLRANPNYWRGKPAIEEIVLQSSSDPTSRVLQITTGQADVAFDIPFASLKQLPAEAKPVVVPIGGVFWVGIRTDVPGPLSDLRVRQAICLAIDRDAINARAFLGNAQPAAAVLSRFSPGWTYEPTLPRNAARDLTKAKELLAQAGASQGFSFSLQTWGARPGWTDAAVVISENLKDIGVTAKVEPIEDAVAIANLQASKLEAQFSGGAGDSITALTSLYTPDGLWAKATKFNQPAISALVNQLRSTTDAVAAQKLQVQILKDSWDKAANLCPLNERAIVIGSRVPTSVLGFVPAEQYFYVATLK